MIAFFVGVKYSYPKMTYLQMTDEYLASLALQDADALCRVASRLLSDLKEAHDRLNQNPQNSLRPSGSMSACLGLPMLLIEKCFRTPLK